MSKTLKQKVDTAIKLLRTAEQQAQTKPEKMVEVNTPAWNTDGGGCKTLIDNNLVEISYSGGKDSDVILRLAQMADIKHIAIHKRTTIDPAGTIQHSIYNKAVILEPKQSFFSLIERGGFPTRRARFCCESLKEYKVLDTAVQGIRVSESTKRAKLYHEPQICRVYGNKKNKVEVFLPILDWTDDDVKEFVEQENVKCHSLYYDQNGCFDPKKRLGCLCCVLQSKRRLIEDFKEHPAFVKAYIRHGKVWWENRPNTSSHQKFDSIYHLFIHNVFCESYAVYQRKYGKSSLFSESSAKQLLEDYFNIDLP